MSGFRRVLFASDFSPASRLAFAKALELARTLKVELIVAHVVAPFVVPDNAMYVTAVDWDSVEKASTEWVQMELDRLARAARKTRVRVTTALGRGYAAEGIVRMAKARRASVIVMGTHGRTGFSRLVMGSVATRVIATAACPVLTVRAK